MNFLAISVFSSLYREIGQKCPQELSRDTAGTKSFAAFLTELAERIPAVLMSSMCILLDYLDEEVGSPDLSRGFKPISEICLSLHFNVVLGNNARTYTC